MAYGTRGLNDASTRRFIVGYLTVECHAALQLATHDKKKERKKKERKKRKKKERKKERKKKKAIKKTTCIFFHSIIVAFDWSRFPL